VDASGRHHRVVRPGESDAVLPTHLFRQEIEETRHAGRLKVVAPVVVDRPVHGRFHRVRRVEADVSLIETEGILDRIHHVADPDDA